MLSPDDQGKGVVSRAIMINTNMARDIKFNVGDRVEIIYNGQVAHSSPPQILGVINITII